MQSTLQLEDKDMHNRKSLTKVKPRGRMSLVEERRRSEWDRGFRTRKQMVGGLPPEDSDAIHHDTREYNVDGDKRTAPAPLPKTKETTS